MAALWSIPGGRKDANRPLCAERCRAQYTHLYIHDTSSATIFADHRKIAARLPMAEAAETRSQTTLGPRARRLGYDVVF